MSSLNLQAGNMTLPPVARHLLPPALRKTFTKKEELDNAIHKIAALAGISHVVEHDNLGSKTGANVGLWKCTDSGCKFQVLASRNWTSNCWEITKLLHADHGDPSIFAPSPSVSPNPKRSSTILPRTSSRNSLSPSMVSLGSSSHTSTYHTTHTGSSIHAFLTSLFANYPHVAGNVGRYTDVFFKEKAEDISHLMMLDEEALKSFCESGLATGIPAWPRAMILGELLKMKRAGGGETKNSNGEETY